MAVGNSRRARTRTRRRAPLKRTTTRTVDVRTVTRRTNSRGRARVHTAAFDRCVTDVRRKGTAVNPYAVCSASMGERGVLPSHRRNPRPARYIAPEHMRRRMRVRESSKWRIVARRPGGMLLNYTGTKLASGGKPIVFPTRELAYRFLRYLRRTFRARLKRVRMLVIPA